MEKRYAIIGAGMSGLMAAGAIRYADREARIMMFDPGTPGGSFADGGFKYLHGASGVMNLLRLLEVDFEMSKIRGGILLDGNVYPYPQHLLSLPRSQMLDIMKAHYVKTRREDIEHFTETSMNDPQGKHHTMKVVVDFKLLISSLLAIVHRFIHEPVIQITPHEVLTDFRCEVYDRLVYTLPLWTLHKIAPYLELPLFACERTRVSVLKCFSTTTRFAGYDYVYTPFTPADIVHRVSSSGAWFDCETTASLSHGDSLARLFRDLTAVLGPSAHVWGGVTLDGHVKHLPLLGEVMAKLPLNWIMAGRFAQWDPRCTIDKVYDHVMEVLGGQAKS